jgi:dTDP-glucose pyrophosphorylase
MTLNFKNLLITEDQSIRTALEKINRSGLKNIIVVNNKNKFKGIITDGDVRRAILKKINLNDQVKKIYNRNPIFIYENEHNNEKAKKIFLAKKIDLIPVINKKKEVSDIIRAIDILYKKNVSLTKKIPIVLMAGGLGKRLAPFTNFLPKALLPLRNKPILEQIILSFYNYRYNDFFLCLNYKSEIIKSYFSKKKNFKIKYVNEKKPLGTCGALRLLKNKLKGDFFLTNCDVLFDVNYDDIFNFHKKNKNQITIVASEKEYQLQYGVCNLTKSGKLLKIVEKPSFDFIINAGLYVMNKRVLSFIPNKSYNVPELIQAAIKKKCKVVVYFISEKSWIDVGQWDEFDNSKNKIKSFNNFNI